MSGGGSDNPNEFHADQIFSARRITLAPITILEVRNDFIRNP